MARGRPTLGFLLIDLPSDHEIERNIVRECQVISAILSNRGLGGRTKIITATSVENFGGAGWRSYKGIGFVHLATHGSRAGIGLIGGTLEWRVVANRLIAVAPPLRSNQKRVLCLSCCYSEAGFKRLRPHLKGHFTHVYHFADEKIGFATAMTVWSMFYRKKSLARPIRAVVKRINEFFERDTIVFREI